MRLYALLDDTANNMGEDHVSEIPLFRTMTLEKHIAMFKRVLDMYVWETSLKSRICQIVLTLEDRREVMFHLSAWLQQPYLEAEALQEMDFLQALETDDTA
ncbi:hypothetical protein HKX48_001835 [Thoreauomyces humboldtii]|nr:hypothetical protein HKX48_001835 [Thoreauomyces humboldtii]